ncbi:kxDL motif-containing protein CG10681 [Galleria mellonella]|uniref:KxDL motif-containing protein CG10681 n=1 Tax=Galleria mellonella TaxID=7137 RepID=A0A6J1WHU6_GALME|nr:kxDL motif-containing protein CG10681 [Galleria mellonella]
MANDTPESDFSIECFQNYSAPEVFVQGLAGMVDQSDVETVIRAQKNMLQRFEKTTEMLTNCNQLSASRLRAASVEFKKHTQLLLEMRKDLEFIFKKIRAIKTKLSTQYPEAYKIAVAASTTSKKPIDEEEELKTATTKTESKMVATVSTETLKPTTSDDRKKKKDSKLQSDETNNNTGDAISTEDKKETGKKVKRNSSSSETESASSSDDSSTDTG